MDANQKCAPRCISFSHSRGQGLRKYVEIGVYVATAIACVRGMGKRACDESTPLEYRNIFRVALAEVR
jgi:hypothetical protein